MSMSREAFFAWVCEKYFNIPPLHGDAKKFINHVREHGAHCVLPGAEIEHPASRELVRKLLLMGFAGYLPSFSVTLHA